MDGVKQTRESGEDITRLHSVASFFLSRVDNEIDKRLGTIGTDQATSLKGKAAIAIARLAYQLYERKFGTAEWAELAAVGAKAAPALGFHRG